MSKRMTLPALVLLVGLASAQVMVWIPDTIATHRVGDSVTVPMYITGHGGQGVVAADITIAFDGTKLTLVDSIWRGSAVPGSWLFYSNTFDCSLLVAAAGIDTLRSDTVLLQFWLCVTDTPGVSPIEILRCRLNEGQVPCSTRSGQVGVTEPEKSGPACRLGLYPNPVRSYINLKGTTPVQLVSASGQRAVAVKPGRNDVSGLPPGIYFVRETQTQAQAQAIRKVVIAR
jgi:hypothetical protein